MPVYFHPEGYYNEAVHKRDIHVNDTPIMLLHLVSFCFLVGNNNESLTFVKVGRFYSGNYYCSARNSLGTKTSPKIRLEVQCEYKHACR